MKKEDWREEAKFLFGHLYIDTEEGFTKIIGEENDLLDFIESEKQKSYEEGQMFTKEELFMLKLATNDIYNEGNEAYEGISKKIKDRLSKLTKLTK